MKLAKRRFMSFYPSGKSCYWCGWGCFPCLTGKRPNVRRGK